MALKYLAPYVFRVAIANRRIMKVEPAHPRSKTDWEWLAMLVTVTLNMVYVLTVVAKPVRVKRMLTCPDCGGELQLVGVLPPPILLEMSLDSS